MHFIVPKFNPLQFLLLAIIDKNYRCGETPYFNGS